MNDKSNSKTKTEKEERMRETLEGKIYSEEQKIVSREKK